MTTTPPSDARADDRHGAHRPTRDELLRSRDELARRVEADRTLREIAAQITALRDPEALLQDVVEHARRLTGSDGAHLTLRVEGGPDLQPFVMAGANDEESRAWLRSIRGCRTARAAGLQRGACR